LPVPTARRHARSTERSVIEVGRVLDRRLGLPGAAWDDLTVRQRLRILKGLFGAPATTWLLALPNINLKLI
jgi:hypothetical protein